LPKNPKGVLVPGISARITKLIENESDRGAILILAAYLDELLADLVRAGCISDEAGNALLEFRRPAGDFDSRIELCAALGLIHSAEQKALHILRRVRNAAAHFDKNGRGFEVLFDSEATANQVESFAKQLNLSLESRDPKAVRQVFVVCCRLLATHLIFRSATVVRRQEPPTLKEVANFIRTQLNGTPQGEKLQDLEAAVRAGNLNALTEFFQEALAQASTRMAKESSVAEPSEKASGP
jgi:hypothetical protein